MQISWTLATINIDDAFKLRREFCRFLHAHAADSRGIDDAEVIFGELLSNAMEHGKAPIEIRLLWDRPEPTLIIADRGSGFELKADLPTNALSEHGRGLYIVSTIGRGLEVAHRPLGGVRVTAMLPVRLGQRITHRLAECGTALALTMPSGASIATAQRYGGQAPTSKAYLRR
ncbi:MAG: ATP-binding protein [Candidatus Eremiobacteraeota bacterium]|nr:ATP-binding protein [Candidatus Eremiobacteraeota bacterium]MBC5826234.1 ATP-binding protein [Candidatus Eremiobacteraeota bacterium]